MKVRVSDIGPDGIEVNGTISVGALNERISMGNPHEIVFLSDPKIELKIYPTVSGAYSTGSVTTRYQQPCSRCADEKEHALTLPANFVFQHRGSDETTEYKGETDTFFDDVGIYYYAGEHIELEEIIQETLLLALSPYWQPPTGEDEACMLCGKKALCHSVESPSTTHTFGQLLRNAGVK